MKGFIEIKARERGLRRLVNIRHIEEVWEEREGSCTIYLAFICPDAADQDYIETCQSYEEIVEMIRRAAE